MHRVLHLSAMLGGLPCFCCISHFTVICLVHITFFFLLCKARADSLQSHMQQHFKKSMLLACLDFLYAPFPFLPPCCASLFHLFHHLFISPYIPSKKSFVCTMCMPSGMNVLKSFDAGQSRSQRFSGGKAQDLV